FPSAYGRRFIHASQEGGMGFDCYVCGENISTAFFGGDATITCDKCGKTTHGKPGCRELVDGRILCGMCAAR
ncbi:MAG: hypothetical protein J4F28_09195, partial [Nitrosopumilaceae archaeon]|nr:hypothetical protein [Nitrosopumilaceae archaeon]